MSHQCFAEALQAWGVHYKDVAMKHTWGHLAPKRNKKYSGYVVFCHASDGALCPIDYDFKDLDGSPWLYDALIDFINENAKEQCKVYRFDGTFCNYEFNGTIKKVRT